MALRLSNLIQFKHYEGDDHVTVTLRHPTPEELNRFLKDRFLQVRNQVKNNLPEARQKLVNKVLVNVEGLTFINAQGTEVPVNKDLILTDDDRSIWSANLGTPVETWRDLIPAHWKNSWAMRFEEGREDSESVPL